MAVGAAVSCHVESDGGLPALPNQATRDRGADDPGAYAARDGTFAGVIDRETNEMQCTQWLMRRHGQTGLAR
jgi:hypothetical protein